MITANSPIELRVDECIGDNALIEARETSQEGVFKNIFSSDHLSGSVAIFDVLALIGFVFLARKVFAGAKVIYLPRFGES